MKKIYLSLVILFSLGLFKVNAQSFKVIVNQTNNISSLSAQEVSDLFLKKKSKWSNGNSVLPVDLSASSNVRANFSQYIHKKNTAAVRSFWQQAAFSGTASAPPEKSNDSEVIEYVKKNPGAIGYVSESVALSGVNTISIK
jgi:ABC-type phosphate transport system substrate-binding protein